MKILIPSIALPFIVSMLLTTCTKQSPVVNVEQIDTLPLLALKDVNPRVLIGSPLEISRGNDKYYSIIKTEFNTGQSLWYARWDGWTGENVFNFSEFNNNVNWMKANNISPTMHMLVGPDTYMPDWLIKGNYNETQLDSLLKRMIYGIMDTNDNKTKVDVWNVLNELFDDDGTYRTNMLWLKMGWETDNSKLTGDDKINARHPIFIRKVLQYCREKTNKKLELRDFGIESDQTSYEFYKKTKAVYQLVKHLQNENVSIDAVGIQGHLTIGKSAWVFENNALKEVVKKFKSLGIEVYITELDIRTDTQVWTKDLAQKQKEDYYNVVKQAVEGGATRIYFWGIQDDFDPFWLQKEHPLPWDANLDKKSAYYGVKEALQITR